MITKQTIQDTLEYKIIDVLTNGNYINGVTAVDIAQKVVEEFNPTLDSYHDSILAEVEEIIGKDEKYKILLSDRENNLLKARNQLRDEQRKLLSTLRKGKQ